MAPQSVQLVQWLRFQKDLPLLRTTGGGIANSSESQNYRWGFIGVESFLIAIVVSV